MNRTHQVTYYLQVEPEMSPWDPERIYSLKPKRITRRRPTKVDPHATLIKVTMNLPDMLFVPVVDLSALEVVT